MRPLSCSMPATTSRPSAAIFSRRVRGDRGVLSACHCFLVCWCVWWGAGRQQHEPGCGRGVAVTHFLGSLRE